MAEEPRGEIEIIPPGEDEDASPRVWIASGSRRIKVVKLGPFASLLTMLAGGLFLLLGLAFFTSVFLVLAPIAFLLAGAAYLTGRLANPFKRLR
jgi:hypothetical protein